MLLVAVWRIVLCILPGGLLLPRFSRITRSLICSGWVCRAIDVQKLLDDITAVVYQFQVVLEIIGICEIVHGVLDALRVLTVPELDRLGDRVVLLTLGHLLRHRVQFLHSRLNIVELSSQIFIYLLLQNTHISQADLQFF